MDGAQFTLRRMPLVALAIAVIVCVVLGGSFGTALIPIRAVLCIAWMLIVTFGAAVMVYQFGYNIYIYIYIYIYTHTSRKAPTHWCIDSFLIYVFVRSSRSERCFALRGC